MLDYDKTTAPYQAWITVSVWLCELTGLVAITRYFVAGKAAAADSSWSCQNYHAISSLI